MKATVRDLDVLNAIQPLQAATYLRANGWHQQSQIADKASVWIQMTDSGEEFEILLPLKPESRDFPLLMSQVLETLEIAEQRSQLEILTTLTTSSADVIRVRVNHPDATDGSIPIDDCVLLLQSVRDMMLSAACSALEPKAYFPNPKPDRATKYLSRVSLGQTERGSYILTVPIASNFRSRCCQSKGSFPIIARSLRAKSNKDISPSTGSYPNRSRASRLPA